MERVWGKVKELIPATEIEGCGLVTILIRCQVQKRNVKTNVLVPRLMVLLSFNYPIIDM